MALAQFTARCSSPAARQGIAWALLASLTVAAGGGEGLHFIPGCGHAVEAGDRVLLIGIEAADRPASGDPRPRAARPRGNGVPVHDEGSCSICSFVGKCGTPDGADDGTPSLPALDRSPEPSRPTAILIAARSHRPRAPPAG
jgi:hypothetical protein